MKEIKEIQELAKEFAGGTYRWFYKEKLTITAWPEKGHWKELHQELGR